LLPTGGLSSFANDITMEELQAAIQAAKTILQKMTSS